MSWGKLTCRQYQEVEEAMNSGCGHFEQVCMVVSAVNRISYLQVNKMSAKRFKRLSTNVEKIFSTKPAGAAKWRIGIYKVHYDIGKLKWRQYVEIQHYLKQPIEFNFHKILASCVSCITQNTSKRHKQISNRLLNYSFLDCFFSVKQIIENVIELNDRYSEHVDIEEIEDNEEQVQEDYSDTFDETWGWLYSTSRIAEHRRISLDEAYELTTMQALNDLQYIKELQKHEDKLFKNASGNSKS